MSTATRPAGRTARIVDIHARSVRSLTVRHQDGEVVDLYRAEPDDRKLTLRNLPAGAAVAHQHQIDFMAGLLKGLSFVDARAGGPSDSALAPGFEATVQTADHLRVTLRAGNPAEDGSLWAAVGAGLAVDVEASDYARAEATRIASRFDGWLLKLPRRISDRLEIRFARHHRDRFNGRKAETLARLPSDRRDMYRSHPTSLDTVTVVPVAASYLSSVNPLRKLAQP